MCTRKDILSNNGAEYDYITVFNGHHHAHISAMLNHTTDSVALIIMTIVMLSVHEFTFIHLNYPPSPTHLHYMI